MNPTAIKLIRWILFLPAAFAAAFVAQLLAALEQFFLAMWIVELNIKFFMGAAFVAAGALVAPTSHAWPAILLLVLQLLGAGSGIALAWMDRNADLLVADHLAADGGRRCTSWLLLREGTGQRACSDL